MVDAVCESIAEDNSSQHWCLVQAYAGQMPANIAAVTWRRHCGLTASGNDLHEECYVSRELWLRGAPKDAQAAVRRGDCSKICLWIIWRSPLQSALAQASRCQRWSARAPGWP